MEKDWCDFLANLLTFDTFRESRLCRQFISICSDKYVTLNVLLGTFHACEIAAKSSRYNACATRNPKNVVASDVINHYRS